MLVGLAVSLSIIPFKVTWLQMGLIAVTSVYIVFRSLKDMVRRYIWVAVFAVGSIGYLLSVDYAFNEILKPHQRTRINVILGLEDDPQGAGYNVNQSLIAIGSGGLTGKGFMKGTQTKLKYVPEQDTDFIFCTVGEEQGFKGSLFVLLLYMGLLLRLIVLAERQSSVFGRVYGYSVVCILLFHLFINIGMVLGITPVIGIPLPFFSYGGSSLWGFTILLAVFLRIDCERTTSY
jgi:rod shape determining protein RodA